MARSEDKPVFLSIGYAACHWCHVMAHESFEDQGIAHLLNQHFVSIKVDREERPDLDEIYMTAVQMITGHGGWPLSVFLTPSLEPFYGGTYFPPESIPGRVGFRTLLERIADAWQTKREALIADSQQVLTALRDFTARAGERPDTPDRHLLDRAVKAYSNSFDGDHGGFGGAPKFPPSMALRLLLREYARSGNGSILSMVTRTLDMMAAGGMYDQLGGGFHRYATDLEWLVPHFEKMLYDNAQLTEAYLEAFQVTHIPLYRRIASQTLDYLLDMMRDPSTGAFYASQDADSEGKEGAYYLWTRDEFLEVLGPDDGAFVCEVYDVREQGNFPSEEPYHHDRNILHMSSPPEELARTRDQSLEQFFARLDGARQRLLEFRRARTSPATDDKVITSWNALAISALVRGHQVLGDSRYLDSATAAGAFFRDRMLSGDTLMHVFGGDTARLPGYLDDYTYLANAFISLWESTADVAWLGAAREVTELFLRHFGAHDGGGLFYAAEHHRNLLVRTTPYVDNAVPSGNAAGALALLRLGALCDEERYFALARGIIAGATDGISVAPQGYPAMLRAAALDLAGPRQIVVAGDPRLPETQALLNTVYARFLPDRVLAVVPPEGHHGEHADLLVKLTQGKTPIDGRAAAYVCRDYACEAPVTEPSLLEERLA